MPNGKYGLLMRVEVSHQIEIFSKLNLINSSTNFELLDLSVLISFFNHHLWFALELIVANLFLSV